MEVGDIIQVSLRGTIRSQPMLNVFWYICQSLVDPPEIEDLYNDFFTEFSQNVVDPCAAVISSSSSFVGVDFLNYTHQSEISENDISTVGLRNEDQTMDYAAWSFTLNRTNKTTRPGGKRIGGIASPDLSFGYPIPTMIPLLTAAAVGMEETLVLSDGVDEYAQFRPIIVGRMKYTNPETLKTYYIPDITRFQPVRSCTWSHVGHQDSRQIY